MALRASLEFWVTVSHKAATDPVRTIIVCVPGAHARTQADVEAYCRRTGWVDEVERSGDVLLAPIVPDGWDVSDVSLPKRLYQQVRQSLKAPGESAIAGRGGMLWAWECLIYLVGYEDGAILAGNALVAHPNFAAAAVLVDGNGPCDLSAGDDPSDHWLVAHPSRTKLNRDVPVHVWLVGRSAADQAFLDHLIAVNRASEERACDLGGHSAPAYVDPNNPAHCAMVTPDIRSDETSLSRVAMREVFGHVIRWKNGPDGTLALHHGKDGFYLSGDYRHDVVRVGATEYPIAVYLPQGAEDEDAKGLPLVVSLHGRGEPAWVFARKNGWEELADETGGFAVLYLDSPGNLWVFERDREGLLASIEAAVESYGFDSTRIYLTGFSNGAIMTYQMATTHPVTFAAASAWNSPGEMACREAHLGPYVVRPGFARCGWQMPFMAIMGDSDDKAPADVSRELAELLPANGCVGTGRRLKSSEAYPASRGYREGERFSTMLWVDADDRGMVASVVMRDMPHGAIADEARAAWEFMSQFVRAEGSMQVQEVR